jgi:hypothetical protein
MLLSLVLFRWEPLSQFLLVRWMCRTWTLAKTSNPSNVVSPARNPANVILVPNAVMPGTFMLSVKAPNAKRGLPSPVTPIPGTSTTIITARVMVAHPLLPPPTMYIKDQVHRLPPALPPRVHLSLVHLLVYLPRVHLPLVCLPLAHLPLGRYQDPSIRPPSLVVLHLVHS